MHKQEARERDEDRSQAQATSEQARSEQAQHDQRPTTNKQTHKCSDNINTKATLLIRKAYKH